MTSNEYQKYVEKTQDYPYEHISVSDSLAHFALGIAGESGEVVDLVKKVIYSPKRVPSDVSDKLEEEIGDLLWYIYALCNTLKVNVEEVILEKNKEKLGERYGLH